MRPRSFSTGYENTRKQQHSASITAYACFKEVYLNTFFVLFRKCLKHTRLQPERFVVYRTENA